MIRRVINIDEEKCNGCGICAEACHEGAIGIVGPTRMDYAKLSAQLSRFAKGLNKLIAETFLDEKDGNH